MCLSAELKVLMTTQVQQHLERVNHQKKHLGAVGYGCYSYGLQSRCKHTMEAHLKAKHDCIGMSRRTRKPNRNPIKPRKLIDSVQTTNIGL